MSQLGLGGGEHLPLQQAASAPAARKPRQRQARPDGPLRRSSRPASAQAAHKLSQQSAGAAGEDAGSEVRRRRRRPQAGFHGSDGAVTSPRHAPAPQSDGGASWEDPGGEEEEGEEEDGDDEEVVEAEVDELVQTELPPAYAGGGGGCAALRPEPRMRSLRVSPSSSARTSGQTAPPVPTHRAAEHGGAAAASGGQRKRQRAGEPKKGGLKGSNLSAMVLPPCSPVALRRPWPVGMRRAP